MYIGRTSQRFHIRTDQHVSKSLRIWVETGLNKTSKNSSAIANHLFNSSDCAKNYRDSYFLTINKSGNDYNQSALKSLFIKTIKLDICKQQYVYK